MTALQFLCLKNFESREDCLRLLRHLLHLLKKRDATLGVFSSYLTKTTLLHTCCSRNQDMDWRISELGRCFEQLVDDFVGRLATGVLSHFFIPTQNLLSDIGPRKRTHLARQIMEQKDNGFPLLQWIFCVSQKPCLCNFEKNERVIFVSKFLFAFSYLLLQQLSYNCLFIVQIALRCLWLWFGLYKWKLIT